MMKHSGMTVAVFAPFLLLKTVSVGEAAEVENEKSQCGKGQALSRMSEENAENNHAQWSPDPELGWVRTEERSRFDGRASGRSKTNRNKSWLQCGSEKNEFGRRDDFTNW